MSKKDHHKESIHKAVQRGNLEAVAAFLKKKPYLVNAEDESGHTPIHLAALHGYYDIAELLAQNGADLNKQDASGWTALHFAASGRNEKLLKLFLDQPTVDVTIKNEGQNIPLHYVAKTYPDISAAIIKTLLERGSNINAQNAQGETPLHGAALKGYDQMAEKLIEFGADPDISNNEGETPLNWATRNNHTKVISVLLKAYSNKGRNKPKLNLKDGRSKREDEVNVVTPKTPSNVQVPKRTSLVSDPLTERYELTFFGDNFLLSLNDDNWDKCLYEGGISLERLKNPNLTPEQSPVPHPDSLKKRRVASFQIVSSLPDHFRDQQNGPRHLTLDC
jgi:ankyrin repeat protein